MNIVSLNCRGLSNSLKRKMIFKSLENASIACLQETYVMESNCKQWALDWNGDFFHHSGSSHSNGLIILVSKQCNVFKISKITINERCLGITFQYLNKTYFIFNIYAPADKEYRVTFLNELTSTLKLNSLPVDSYVILAGDFNTYSCDFLDNIRGHPHCKKEIESFNHFVQSNSLIDCWRQKNPEIKDFSWIRCVSISSTDPTLLYFSARRLDSIFCSNNLSPFLNTSKMSHISASDHKLVSAFFQIDPFPKGPGRWQFNDTLLDDYLFISHMKDYIFSFKLELSTYDCLDKRLFWELLKSGIKDQTISLTRAKNIKKLNENDLDNEIEKLTEQLITDPNNLILIKNLNTLTQKKMN